MKIQTFGARFFGAQIDRVEDGFAELSHEITSNYPDLIYSNDADGYEQAIKQKELFPESKLILNILDVPFWIPDFEKHKEKWLPLLKRADIVTSISKTTQKYVLSEYGLESEVIYNPIKDITNLNFKRYNNFLFVGRANDLGKRFNLVKDSISLIQKQYSVNLLVVGSENPNFGNYAGVVSDKQLNYIYNSHQFMIYPSKHDGLGLTPAEMIVSGGISLVCDDSETSNEFFPDFLKCASNPNAIVNKIFDITQNYSKYQKDLFELSICLKQKFDKVQIAKNIIEVYNKL